MKTERNVLLLIKIISALYFENLSPDKNPLVMEECKEILSSLKFTGGSVSGLGSEEAAEEALRQTTEWMISVLMTNEVKLSRDNIMQRLMVNLHCDNEYVEVAKKYLSVDVTAQDARNRVNEILSELRYDKKQSKLKQTIYNAHNKLTFDSQNIDNSTFVQTLLTELENLNTSKSGELPGFVGMVNFDNYKEIEKVLKKASDLYDPKGIMSTGMQGLDRATGVGGIKRGECVNFGATTHNYKSGELIDLSLYIPFYNEPWLWDENKKPAIIQITFENTIEQNIGTMYKKLHEIRYQERITIDNINTIKAAKYLTEHFKTKGYHFFIESYDPNNFTIYDLIGLISKYIQNGYEIHAITCDYLPLIAHNTVADRLDTKIQKTYEMIRNFCYPKGISFITGCQLSTEAATLQRDNTTTFTKKVNTGGWYMDCKSLHTKLDLEFILGKHVHQDGFTYLAYSRGKHRGGENTPQKHQHFWRRFDEFGGIVPDVGTDDKTMYRLPDLLDLENMASW